MADVEGDINREVATEERSVASRVGGFLKHNLLLILMISSLILGCGIGFGIKLNTDRNFTSDEIKYISFPGTLFLNMLKVRSMRKELSKVFFLPILFKPMMNPLTSSSSSSSLQNKETRNNSITN